ncbi:hypothetical protein NQ317_001673 [Molorchus minor]|uniref:N-acetyltransferase domain-containing protein n=1 Tax=Molorchus minor TaxID=1323400 RepID=A0ABQ9JHS4_9CUCU|nr:hypothetical protein NQ317_001673 [Molorchus minor]
MSLGAVKLRSWLNKSFRIEMTDGRILIGIFVCTDRDANVILASCSEYLPSDGKVKSVNEEPRMLGLVMIPGKHIVSVHIDASIDANKYDPGLNTSSNKKVNADNVMCNSISSTAMCEDECVGAIVCKLDLHRKVIKRGYIAMLAVDQKYRKLRIGSTLVQMAINEMLLGDADEVVLETEVTNKPALQLYEKLGFVRDKRLF